MAGPSSTLKTFTFPNASATVLTTDAPVTPAQGGAGASNVATAGRFLRGDGINFVTSSVAAAGVGACGANQWISAANDNAVPTCTQPAFSHLSGTATASQVPHTLLSTFHTDATAAAVVRGDIIGGVGATPTWQRIAHPGAVGRYLKSSAAEFGWSSGAASGTGSCGANLFVTATNDDAAPTCTQPAFSNLSGAASSGQVPHTMLSAFHTDTTAGSVVRGDLIAGIGATPTWQRVARGGTNSYPKWNSSGDLEASSGAAAGTGTCTNQFVRAENADAAPTCASVAGTDFANQSANNVFAGPSSGGAAAPTFRALVKADQVSATVYTDQANTWSTGAQDMGSAASLKVPTSAAAAPTAVGLVAYDSTATSSGAGQRWTAGGNQTTTGYFPRVLAAKNCTASGSCSGTDNLVCSTIGTTETAYAMNYTIPANFLTTNKVLRVSASFEATTSASPPTLTGRIRLGGVSGTAVYSTAGAQAAVTSVTNQGFGALYYITGTAVPGASVAVETGVGPHEQAGNLPFSSKNGTAQAVNVATNASQAITFTLTCSANTAGNSIRMRQLIVEELN